MACSTNVYVLVQLRQHDGLLSFKDVIISVINAFINRDKGVSCRLLLTDVR